MERVGLRLQLRKQQAEAGDIVLLYGDESEALTHPYLARAWAKSGEDLRVPAPGQAKKVAMLGSLDHLTRQLIVHTSPTKRSSDFIVHLEQLDRLYGLPVGAIRLFRNWRNEFSTWRISPTSLSAVRRPPIASNSSKRYTPRDVAIWSKIRRSFVAVSPMNRVITNQGSREKRKAQFTGQRGSRECLTGTGRPDQQQSRRRGLPKARSRSRWRC